MKREMTVCLGESGANVGTLVFEARGQRQSVAFMYAPSWLGAPDAFAISPQAGDAASLQEALAVAPQFQLNPAAALRVLDQVKGAVAGWESVAKGLGMTAADMARFAPAFAHPEF